MSDETAERPPTLRWWDIITAVVLFVVASLTVVRFFSNGGLFAVLSFVSLLVVAVLYVWLGRPALRTGMSDGKTTAASLFFLLSIVLVVGFASTMSPSLASLQALVYPMIWVISDRYRLAVAWSAALATSIGIGSAIAYLRTDGEVSPWVAAMVAVISFAFAVTFGTWISRIVLQGVKYRELAERLRASQQRVVELSAQTGAAAERERLSRELHDTLTQTLTGLVMLSEQAQRALGEGDVERAEERMTRTAEASRVAMAEARALVATTQPLGDGGLVQAINRVAHRLHLDTGLSVECELEEIPLDRELEVVLLRVAQEGLANARKHARAQAVRVVLVSGGGDGVVLRVEDDGVGPGPEGEAGSGFGLAGLQERLRSVGGTLEFGARAEGGSVLEVRVPAMKEGHS